MGSFGKGANGGEPRLTASHGRAWAVRAAMDDAKALVPLPARSGPGQASTGLAVPPTDPAAVQASPMLPLKAMPPQARALPGRARVAANVATADLKSAPAPSPPNRGFLKGSVSRHDGGLAAESVIEADAQDLIHDKRAVRHRCVHRLRQVDKGY